MRDFPVQLNPLLIASYAVTVLIDIGTPVAVAVFLARRYRASWRYWLYGVLVFLVSQVLTRVPVMIFVQTRPSVQAALAKPVWFWLFLFAAAFTAGLFEEGGRWLAFRFLVRPAERTWRNALMLGAGHGGLESILIGLVALAGLAIYVAITLLPPEAFGSAASHIEGARKELADLSGWEPLLGGWERFCTVFIHLGLTVLVLQAFRRGPVWWWLALGAHTLVDFTTVGFLREAQRAWGSHRALLLTEALVLVYGLLSLWIIVALRPGPEEKLPAAAEPAPVVEGPAEPAAGTQPG
jgi:uncharacterized membrane protein YhfC